MRKPMNLLGISLLAFTASTFCRGVEVFAAEDATRSKVGLVQLWQVVPGGQTAEGATTKEIMSALQCRPNHDLNPIAGGKSTHTTYVNSCYVDDALYLGEDSGSYHIYLAGYEGKVAKSKSHYFELDLNGDGRKVKYEIQTVAYFIPDGGATYQAKTIQDTPLLEYATDYLDKDLMEAPEALATFSDDAAVRVSGTVQSPSYYANENGTLVHYLTNNVRSTSYSKTIVGKAPSWMKANTRYYSYDNVYFYSDWRDIRVDGKGAVNASKPFYNYYQYLPFRTSSNLTAAHIDSFTKSYGYTNLPSSYPASNNQSQLVGAGKYFIAVQSNYGINGALQYAMGIHESGWGRSSLSINKNNLFGMNATDSNPYGNGTSFDSVEKGINYHADRYLSWGYTDPVSDWRYFGSHVGNKGSGMNVKYASDPFWGEKIAGWYYRFDQEAGLKDHDFYAIGIKQKSDKYNVRSSASNSATTYYQTYNQKSNLTIADYPVVLTGVSGDFYRIKTDTPIVDGVAKYNGTYDWTKTNGYLAKSAIQVVNHTTYRNPTGGLSNNAMFKTLTSDLGTWSQPFESKVTKYTVTLPKYSETITFSGTLADSTATIVGGLGTHQLKPDAENVIKIQTRSQRGTLLTYEITVVNPRQSNNAMFKTLSSDLGTWDQPFNSRTTKYTITLPKYSETITFSGTLADKTATYVGGLGTHTLKPDAENVIKIQSRSQKGTLLTYEITVVNPRQSNNAMFKTLSSDMGTWDQAFNSRVTKYRITLPKYSETITFTGALADKTATYVGGLGTHTLKPDAENVIKIQSRSQKGTLLTYEITVVNPRQSNNAMFKTMSTNVGTWNQTYDPYTTKYTVTLPTYQSSITVSGKLWDSTATLVGGIGKHTLVEGKNVIKVQSRSQKGTLLTYQLTVNNPKKK